MDILIIKLGATGDVVRTTPLLRRLTGAITWLTEARNALLLQNLETEVRVLPWEERERLVDKKYDLIINLEDSSEAGLYLRRLKFKQLFGAYVDSENKLRYTDDSRHWFDLSLISAYGRLKADKLKFQNRRTYQELIFEGLGMPFSRETYLLPDPIETELSGDVAIAAEAGQVWPMKKWAYYDELKQRLECQGLVVNVLPKRPSLLEHLADVRAHMCLVGGDSLPMHFALGTKARCVTLFTCTSPWEIHDYGVQTQLVSPCLEEFFYKRGYDERATIGIGVDEVFTAVMSQLETAAANPVTAK
jgi:ADP-heptose:LPS heptosyltransferase